MRVAFILSSVATCPRTGTAIGVWLEELLAPYYYLGDLGARIRIATPCGGHAAIDPASLKAIEGGALRRRFDGDAALARRLAGAERIADLRAGDLDAIFYPGGYSPLHDLRQDRDSIALIESMFELGKAVGAVCHGVCALLDAQADGRALVQGRRVTGFSDSEERAIGMDSAVPYSVEQALRAQGARYFQADDWDGHVIADGNLYTGQNPASAGLLARRITESLS